MALTAATLLIATSSAHAQQLGPGVMAARRTLIEQAQQASERGEHERALDLARRASELRMSASLRRFIAEEQAALGDHVSSLASARLCIEELERDPVMRDRALHMTACRAIATAEEMRVARVVVEVPPATHASVRLNGTEVPPALWGVAYMIQPGSVALDATADGMAPVHIVRDVSAGSVESLRVEWSALPLAPPEPVASSSPPPPPSAAPIAPVLPRVAHRASLVGPIAVAGGGALAFIGAGVFYALRNTALAERDSMCTFDHGALVGCPDSAEPAHDRAFAFTVATDVALAAGGVALVVSAVWLIVDLRPRVRPTVANVRGGGVVGIEGSF